MADDPSSAFSPSCEDSSSDAMAGGREPPFGTPIHRSSSRPQLDLSGAAIHGSTEDRPPPILLPNQSDDIFHFAIDIGGSLIKLVYFSRHSDSSKRTSGTERVEVFRQQRREILPLGFRRNFPVLGGRLHFVKFETSKMNDCLDFIQSKKLHCSDVSGHHLAKVQLDHDVYEGPTIKATGGGAFKYADLLKEKLGVTLDKEDEMDCLVAGANFLLRAIRDEAFTHMEGQKRFVLIDHNDMFPYLLVNVGSGVSMIKVDGDGKFQRVSGTNVGGGTFWGLGRLLTKCKNFDEILELSQKGDNSYVDMLVGDIYGGLDYSKVSLLQPLPLVLGRQLQEAKIWQITNARTLHFHCYE